jgi:DNA-binding PadR family transcriptional regulator
MTLEQELLVGLHVSHGECLGSVLNYAFPQPHQTLTAALKRLVRQGLVLQGRRDRHGTMWSLTEAGALRAAELYEAYDSKKK